ncbi:MAG: hypothetical protein WCX88_01625 [Patescibacteria group bacterium]
MFNIFKKKKRFLTEEDIQDTKVASRKYLLKIRQKRFRKIYIILSIVLFFGVISFLLFCKWFNIRGLEIERENAEHSLVTNDQMQSIFENQLDQKKWFIFSQRNIFLFDSEKFKENIIQNINLDVSQVHKKINFKIQLVTTEKKPVAVFVFQNAYYYIDRYGKLIRPLLAEEEPDSDLVKVFFSVIEPVVVEPDLVESKALNGEVSEAVAVTESQPQEIKPEINSLDFLLSKMDESRINFVLNVKQKLITILPNIKIDAFEFLDPQVSDVRVHTNQGYVIYFDQQIELERQISNLKIVLDQKLKNKNIKYIDLRYKDRIYYQE